MFRAPLRPGMPRRRGRRNRGDEPAFFVRFCVALSCLGGRAGWAGPRCGTREETDGCVCVPPFRFSRSAERGRAGRVQQAAGGRSGGCFAPSPAVFFRLVCGRSERSFSTFCDWLFPFIRHRDGLFFSLPRYIDNQPDARLFSWPAWQLCARLCFAIYVILLERSYLFAAGKEPPPPPPPTGTRIEPSGLFRALAAVQGKQLNEYPPRLPPPASRLPPLAESGSTGRDRDQTRRPIRAA